LSQDGIRESLLAFHKKWYSSNIMTLAMTSNTDLDTMTKMVEEKFSHVINQNVVLPNLSDPNPYNPENLGQLIKFVPVKDKDMLTLHWVLPYS